MRIALVGPESTGKSTLASFLASHFNGVCIDEYAREYVEGLDSPYTEQDVENVAIRQIEQLKLEYDKEYVFFDTDLVITKVWFDVVYHHCPQWVTDAMSQYKPDAYLVCLPDIAFQPDKVRENGDRREQLLSLYLREIELLGVPCQYVSGKGRERELSAIAAVHRLNGLPFIPRLSIC